MSSTNDNTRIIKEIESFLKDDFKHFDKIFNEVFKSNFRLINTVLSYVLKQKGKKIRPILVMLSAKMFGNVNSSAYHAASLIELLHTATLIHDDVVDNTEKRRNVFTISALWKNKISVLTGDYLLSKGMLLALENKEYNMLSILSRAVKDMSEGELLQVEKSRKINYDKKIYFDIISKKTASLFAACCACGCAANCQDEKQIEIMWEIGKDLGIIFQLQDDLFDLVNSKSGKSMYNDLKEQKNTLAVLYTLKSLKKKKKKIFTELLKKNNKSTSDLQTLVNYISEMGGIEYVRQEIIYRKSLLVEKMNLLPSNEATKNFIKLSDYIIDRDF